MSRESGEGEVGETEVGVKGRCEEDVRGDEKSEEDEEAEEEATLEE